MSHIQKKLEPPEEEGDIDQTDYLRSLLLLIEITARS
jgi:hypothetical protein